MELIIVTGMSGSGKSRAVNALEDIGFYCIDNIPPSLIPKFVEICNDTVNNNMSKVALVTDARGGDVFSELKKSLGILNDLSINYKVLFLDSDNEVLIKRYKETRRKHPLQSGDGASVSAAVRHERELLAPLRAIADYIVDTSHTTVQQLKERITMLFLGDASRGINVHCMSFGFKHGAAGEVDLLFDVRCLPNPYYIDELRPLTGLDPKIKEYVLSCEQTVGFVTRLFDMIDYLLPLYCNEGKSELVIGMGCTGGKHRSVVLAELIFQHIVEKGYHASVNHRDIGKASV